MMKILLIIGVALFYGVIGVYRLLWLYKKTGVNPLKLKSDGSIQSINKQVFALLILFDLLVVILFCLGNSFYQYTSPIQFLNTHTWLKIAGVVLSAIAFIWIVIAQSNMKTSWRIGIDNEEKTALIKTGFFRYSRNPVFFGLVVSAVGFFLILPNAITLCITILCSYSISVQIRLEEQYLESKHKEEYLDYKRAVRRWV
ncbi:MAG: methyltransferase family protein [Flavobacteriaceae bacterium]